MTDPKSGTIEHPTLRVLVLAASLRKNSLNAKLARMAADHARTLGATVDQPTIGDFDVPSFNGDEEEIPAGARELNRRLLETDAFVIASPEYNASMPGCLKNLIDWTSRIRPQPFHEKHALLMSASPSMVGGNRGLWALRVPLEHLGARVYPDMFSLALAHKAFDGDRLTDVTQQDRFKENVQGFLSLAEAAKHYPCIKKAWVEFLGEQPGELADRVEVP
jgi:chromate reductase, NAD(P)H dehydrogenase (quinone)